jgi:hypothetical protein
MPVRLILRRNHVGISFWRNGRLTAALCCLLYPTGSNRPRRYPRLHVALDWHGRAWVYFSGIGVTRTENLGEQGRLVRRPAAPSAAGRA